MINEVELIHPGGECKILPVETINRASISIRWGMSGIYDINLRLNVMRARSLKARRKGRCDWKVKNIDKLRLDVEAYFNASERDSKEQTYDKHDETMPKAR